MVYGLVSSCIAQTKGVLFSNDEEVENNVHNNDQSAKDILRYGCKVGGVNYRDEILFDETSAV
jgi:hypothetical protein